jgi:3-hydroxyacyl-CoA dehydrogenase/3a,7a,12a-trihydroxy-5b-cholest-24-enoyl-CoA hydratase
MPIDVDKAVGAELPPMEYACNPEKIILYALGVGAKPEGDELAFVYENGLKALPTFGVIPPFPALMSLMSVPGMDINPVMALHGEHTLEVRKHPIPTEGILVSKPKVSAIYDKGKGALIDLDVETFDQDGNVVFLNRFGAFIRGEGGFGGEKGPPPGNEPPERPPDATVEMTTLPQHGALYRLSGDHNPLHIDPQIAAMVGYDRPILHGLCTFGHVGRAVLRAYCGNDPERFKSIKVRFARPVWPGDTIVTEMWKLTKDRINLRVRTKERPEEYALTNATVERNP